MSFWRRLGGLGARSPRPTSTHRCSRSAPVCMASPPPAASKRLNFRGFLNPLYLFHVPFISSLVLLSFFGRKMPGGAQRRTKSVPKCRAGHDGKRNVGGGGGRPKRSNRRSPWGPKNRKFPKKCPFRMKMSNFSFFRLFGKIQFWDTKTHNGAQEICPGDPMAANFFCARDCGTRISRVQVS